MSASGSLWLIPALPLLGAGVNLFLGKRLGRSAGIFAAVLVAASFAVSVAVVGEPRSDSALRTGCRRRSCSNGSASARSRSARRSVSTLCRRR